MKTKPDIPVATFVGAVAYTVFYAIAAVIVAQITHVTVGPFPDILDFLAIGGIVVAVIVSVAVEAIWHVCNPAPKHRLVVIF